MGGMVEALRGSYRMIFDYHRSNRKWCWMTVLALAEILVFTCLHTEADHHYEIYLAETMGQYDTLLGHIFWENLRTALRTVLIGAIPFGIGILFNSYFTCSGLVATAKLLLPRVGGMRLLLCAAPHGMLEISAIVFSFILSVLWSRAITFELLRLHRDKPGLKTDCRFLFRAVVFVLIPLTLVAALTETYISALVVEMII